MALRRWEMNRGEGTSGFKRWREGKGGYAGRGGRSIGNEKKKKKRRRGRAS